MSLNYSVTDYGSGIDSCWFFILNSTSGYEISNTTIPNCQNTTFNVSDEKTFTLFLYANDSYNNINYSSVEFAVSTIKPSITLDYPTNDQWINYLNNIYLNFTPSDANGIDTCELWGNWTGIWHKNYTWINPTNATMNYTTLNLSEGYYKWNVWCNDSSNNPNWALNNKTFGADAIYPIVNITSLTTTIGSQTITFNFSVNDNFINSCKYSIFNSSGGIDGLNNNVTLSCGAVGTSATVSAYASYNLTVYAIDKAGNENSTKKLFTTTASGGAVGGMGGGGIGGVFESILTTNFTISTQTFGNLLDFVLAKGSIRPRERNFIITNKAREPININLVCDTTLLNETEDLNITIPQINICDYVYFENTTITLSSNELNPSVGKIMVYTPENASYGDVYYYNILAIRQTEQEELYAKLSVKNRVPHWAIVYKWAELFGQGNKPKEERTAYPVFWVSLVTSLVSYFLVLLGFSSFKVKGKALPGTSFLASTFAFFIIFTGLLYVL